jgi:hypothetical protein
MTKIVRGQGRFLAFSLFLLLFLLSACGGQQGTIGSQPTPTPKPKDPTTLLNDTQSAMQALKSEHQIVSMTAGGEALSALTSSNPSDSSIDMSQASFDMKIEDDIQRPDQSAGTLHMNVSIGSTQINYNLNQVSKDNKTYIQNMQGNWYVLDQQSASDPSGNPFVSFTKIADFDGMASSFQKGQVTDHGYETVNGVRLRHLTSALDQNVASSQLGTESLNNLDTAAIDVWIDEATSYMHRADLKLTFKPSSMTESSPTGGAGPTLDILLEFSKFNQPVTITAPEGAVPATSFADALK